jgi:DNA-binding phage protein
MPSPRRPGRPTWTPTPEDQRALDALAALAAAADAADEAMWQAARAARERGIPMDRIAAVTRRGRTTVYRNLDETGATDDDG